MNRLFVLFFVSLVTFSVLRSQTQFSQEQAARMLHHISVTIGARPMGSPAEREAMEFAVKKFMEHGCDTAYIIPMKKTEYVNTNSGIAVGIKRGTTDRIIVIGGHIDSAEPEIPGADDDGSGTAVVLEASRVLCTTPHQSTLVFCCFGGEEVGLEGSRYFVNNFKDIQKVSLMLQVDMANGLGTIDIDPETYGASAPRWLVNASVEEFYRLGYSNLRYPTFFFTMNYAAGSGSGSDHESFLKKGIPAVDFSTDVSKPIHTPRDNFENFDQRGLKRSGDLIIKLAERFDAGVPSKELDSYLLFLFGQQPVYISPLGQQLLCFLGLSLAIGALIIVRRKKVLLVTSGKWSFPKLLLMTLIIVLFAWFSSNLVGMLKGVRHPWMAYPYPFYLLALLGLFTGAIVSFRLSRFIRISPCPYRLFRYSFIILTVMFIGAMFVSIKLALAPAWALFFLGLAIIVKPLSLRIAFFLLSPFWMMRLIFSEWKELIFRALGMSLPDSLGATLLFNGAMVLMFSLYSLPFIIGGTAIIRLSPRLRHLLTPLRTNSAVGVTIVLFFTAVVLMTNVPSYNKLWYRDIHAEITRTINTKETAFTVKSSEYLHGVSVEMDGKKTVLSGRVTHTTMPVPQTFDTSLVKIDRNDSTSYTGDTMNVSSEIIIRSKIRPYRINITYTRPESSYFSIFSPHRISIKNEKEYRLIWNAYPDTLMSIPIEFRMSKGDTVHQKISLVFSALPEGVTLEGELCYTIPRTEFIGEKNYIRAVPSR